PSPRCRSTGRGSSSTRSATSSWARPSSTRSIGFSEPRHREGTRMASIAGFEDLELFNPPQTYTSAARGYEAAQPGWGRVIDRSLELARPAPGDALLDIGCGPGILAVRAA